MEVRDQLPDAHRAAETTRQSKTRVRRASGSGQTAHPEVETYGRGRAYQDRAGRKLNEHETRVLTYDKPKNRQLKVSSIASCNCAIPMKCHNAEKHCLRKVKTSFIKMNASPALNHPRSAA
jgi:hypothetical protein